jgi:protein-tyrosine-phosphatase
MPRDLRQRSQPPVRFVRVLFLSTGNSARSPIAESILLWLSRGQAVVASAGVAPLKEIHPMARGMSLRLLKFSGGSVDDYAI